MQYHNYVIEKVKKFQYAHEGRGKGVDYNSNKGIKFADNQRILPRIIEAVVLCAEQDIALRGYWSN